MGKRPRGEKSVGQKSNLQSMGENFIWAKKSILGKSVAKKSVGEESLVRKAYG